MSMNLTKAQVNALNQPIDKNNVAFRSGGGSLKLAYLESWHVIREANRIFNYDWSSETLKMDLWTKEMPIDEMKSFMLQTFISMKNSILKATGDENLVNLVDDFCVEFEKRVSKKN